MKVLVDADACPVTAIIEQLAQEFQAGVVLITDVNHLLESDYADIITVGQGSDAVDYALINRKMCIRDRHNCAPRLFLQFQYLDQHFRRQNGICLYGRLGQKDQF